MKPILIITSIITAFSFSACAVLDGKEVTVSHGGDGTSLTVKVPSK